MKERPILFSASMVRALLEGRKTQTRRVVARANSYVNGVKATAKVSGWADLDLLRAWVDPGPSPAGNPGPYLKAPLRDDADERVYRVYPQWQVGDRLWVRETWGMSYTDLVPTDRPFIVGGTWGSPSRPGRPPCVVFKADGDMPDDSPLETARWSPSIHMPRWASRITLEITGIRVERLNSISRWVWVIEFRRVP